MGGGAKVKESHLENNPEKRRYGERKGGGREKRGGERGLVCHDVYFPANFVGKLYFCIGDVTAGHVMSISSITYSGETELRFG